MKQTQQIFLENFKNNLVKIRLKIDPVHNTRKDLSILNGYEGYILNENLDDSVDILVLGGDIDEQIVKNVPCDCVELDKIEKFKVATKAYLQHKLDIEVASDIYFKVDRKDTMTDIEDELKKFGLSHEAICEIYKLYVLTNEPI